MKTRQENGNTVEFA